MTPYLSLQAHTLSLSKCEPWQSRFFLLSYLNGLIRYPYVYFFPLLIWPSKITLRKQTFLLRKSLAVSDRPNFFYTFRFSMLLDKMSRRFCNIKATPTTQKGNIPFYPLLTYPRISGVLYGFINFQLYYHMVEGYAPLAEWDSKCISGSIP